MLVQKQLNTYSRDKCLQITLHNARNAGSNWQLTLLAPPLSFIYSLLSLRWDQWILDVGLSNALGIFIGCKLASYLEMKEYRWGSYTSIPSYLGKAKRTLLQFTPASWTKVEWKPTSSLKRIAAVQLLMLAMHLEELNAFFLKFILWVPPESKLNGKGGDLAIERA